MKSEKAKVIYTITICCPRPKTSPMRKPLAVLMPHQIRITGIKCEQWFIAEEAKAWVNQGLYAPIGSFEKCLLEHRVGIPARKATVEEIIEHFKKREK